MKSFFFSNEKVFKMFFKFFLPEYSTTCKIFQISKQWKSNDHEEWGKTSPPNNLISSWVGSCEWCSVPMRNLMRNPYYYLALFFQNPFRYSWRVEHDAISFCDKSLFLDLVKFSHLLQKKLSFIAILQCASANEDCRIIHNHARSFTASACAL